MRIVRIMYGIPRIIVRSKKRNMYETIDCKPPRFHNLPQIVYKTVYNIPDVPYKEQYEQRDC